MKILFVFGTRPEGIKLSLVIKELEKHFETKVCVTGQHKEMLDQVLELFEIKPDDNLNVMQHNQSLNMLTSEIIKNIDAVYEKQKPDLVMVHGDTTTSFCASLAAFHRKIPIGHIEAGLRTYNCNSPYPEEVNRQLTRVLAQFHFAPTPQAKKNLLNEGVLEKNIVVTGNTVIDALFYIQKHKLPKKEEMLSQKFSFLKKKFILVTGHRRENFSGNENQICVAIHALSKCFQDIDFIYPMHLSPKVRESVGKNLSNLPNVHLIEPLDYLSFVYLMEKSIAIMSDSGGIQEEAPSLGKYVLVMRDTTERLEAVKAKTAILTGAKSEDIIKSLEDFLLSRKYEKVIQNNPYGDGGASRRILKFLKEKI